MSTTIIVHGAAGRMGRRIIELALEEPARFQVAAGVDLKAGTLSDLGLKASAPLLTRLEPTPGAVVIDFSHPDAACSVVHRCIECGMPLVLGTTGLPPAKVEALLEEASQRIPMLWSANMSLGINLILGLAARMAQALGPDFDCEIVEAHHHHKLDAPSGTALAIADAILAATDRTRADLVHGRAGQTGERKPHEIGMHALRLGDVVGDHQVLWCSHGERIGLSHMAHSRDVFVRGALRAAAWLARQKPGRYGMRDVLGLAG